MVSECAIQNLLTTILGTSVNFDCSLLKLEKQLKSEHVHFDPHKILDLRQILDLCQILDWQSKSIDHCIVV